MQGGEHVLMKACTCACAHTTQEPDSASDRDAHPELVAVDAPDADHLGVQHQRVYNLPEVCHLQLHLRHFLQRRAIPPSHAARAPDPPAVRTRTAWDPTAMEPRLFKFCH